MTLHAANNTSAAGFRASPRPSRESAHPDTLRSFPALVRQLGGNPDVLLTQAGIDPAVLLRAPGSIIDYRSRVRLLERAALELSCPDFGLRLASAQSSHPAVGPIGVAMKKRSTLGEEIGRAASGERGCQSGWLRGVAG